MLGDRLSSAPGHQSRENRFGKGCQPRTIERVSDPGQPLPPHKPAQRFRRRLPPGCRMTPAWDFANPGDVRWQSGLGCTNPTGSESLGYFLMLSWLRLPSLNALMYEYDRRSNPNFLRFPVVPLVGPDRGTLQSSKHYDITAQKQIPVKPQLSVAVWRCPATAVPQITGCIPG
jgi:hypothetical protein